MSQPVSSSNGKAIDDVNNLRENRKLLKDEKKRQKLEKFKMKSSSNVVKKEPKIVEINQPTKLNYDFDTKPGERKNTLCPLPDKYHPSYVEAAWYEWWLEQGFFKPEYKTPDQGMEIDGSNVFSMLIPPPNVTGTLHLGHALMCSIEDAFARWNRMLGKTVLWVPGVDHAGIATQVVVEKKLMREQRVSRHDLGREKFIEEVRKWKSEKGDVICQQMRRMAISVDWSKSFFTMDTTRSTAVSEAFIRMHNKGLIYRAKRLVNWSCALKSAISDIEVEKLDISGRQYLTVPGYDEKIEFGTITEFAYQIQNTSEKIIVATTRLETMLGDVAIAVYPEDSRYKKFIGKYAIHPFCSRLLPIICDGAVDQSFGTGAVKITPAHDPTDYEIGQRHNLPMINILDDAGCIVHNLGLHDQYQQFCGMKRFDARRKILAELTNLGLYIGKSDHTYVVPVCSRSKDIIEPVLRSQWYVRCMDAAKKALDAVESGNLSLHPKNHVTTWNYWMENIQDWCISRQLWWGHRIPAYFIRSSALPDAHPDNDAYWVSAHSHEEALRAASQKFSIPNGDITLSQDEDVLDTWFSSGLLALSAWGWPDPTPYMKNFYPSSLLETGHDILFFWVARMVIMSQLLHGSVPFQNVLLHPIVRDAHGRKMSKSLGNIIDPIDIIEGITLENLHNQLSFYNLDAIELDRARKGQTKDFPSGIPECGTDALRFALCVYTGSKKDINLDVLRVQGYRFFCNKVWNAVRFCLINRSEAIIEPHLQNYELSLMDRWILCRLSNTIANANSSFQQYDASKAACAIYDFWLHDFCDVYIESIKPLMQFSQSVGADVSRRVMLFCSDCGLRLLHPFMPFVTEELYQRLPFPKGHFESVPSICVSNYPYTVDYSDPDLENDVSQVMSTVTAIRSIKDDYVPTKTKVQVIIHTTTETNTSLMRRYEQVITALSGALSVVVTTDESTVPRGCAVTSNGAICDVYILLKGYIDVSQELSKTQNKFAKTQENLSKLQQALAAPGYETKVPDAVKNSNIVKLDQLNHEMARLEKIIANLKLADQD